MTLQEMKIAQKAALDKANAFVTAAEARGNALTEAETTDYNAAMAEYRAMGVTVKAREEQNTIREVFPNGSAALIEPARNAVRFGAFGTFGARKWATEEYLADFAAYVSSVGAQRGEHLRAGGDELGGYKVPSLRGASYEGAAPGSTIVPVSIEQTIVPLAPPVFGIESISSVIPTTTDLKFPRKTAIGTAAIKAEGTGNGSNVFTGTTMTADQYTLSAFMVGHPEDISWELSQDVPAFLSFLQDDILLSIAVKKGILFAGGSGSGQPQGIKGNVAAGITGVVADGAGNLLPLVDTLDLLGKLNVAYREGARWVMTVATGINFRKQQLADNLFSNVFVSVNGVDYFHGFPVTYDNNVDEIGAGTTPLYFGNFKAGYQIGVRGGAGVNVKYLDQPKALEGLLTVLGYQRVDGRVRRSEAIQSLTLHV